MRPILMQIVIDTNVYIAALRSSTGASYAILQMIYQRKLAPLLSVPLLMEIEEVAKRPGMLPHLDNEEIEVVLNMIANRGIEQKIHFSWRPFLPDPDDDMLVELAIAGSASHIVTGNLRDLEPAKSLGLVVLTPAEFIRSVCQTSP